MDKKTKIGIIICDRYKSCSGGKCFRAMRDKDGAFNIYSQDEDLEMVGYTSCGGCPGGNIEYACEEMQKNGAEVVHLATGLVVGYPPCPYTSYFRKFLVEKFGIKVIVGTHPIPQKYYITHKNLGTWGDFEMQELTAPTLADEKIRLSYD